MSNEYPHVILGDNAFIHFVIGNLSIIIQINITTSKGFPINISKTPADIINVSFFLDWRLDKYHIFY